MFGTITFFEEIGSHLKNVGMMMVMIVLMVAPPRYNLFLVFKLQARTLFRKEDVSVEKANSFTIEEYFSSIEEPRLQFLDHVTRFSIKIEKF